MSIVVGRGKRQEKEPSEAETLQAIRLALGQLPDARFWRNNVGVAYFDRPVKYGLGNGSPDLVGIVQHVTPDGIVGRFCALEVKNQRGFLTGEQANFLQLIRDLYGFAAMVRNPAEALAAVERCRKGERK